MKYVIKMGLFWFMVLLLPLNVSAQRGCCSHHGGVAGCNSSGRTICSDGTLSPSCTCTPPVVYGCTDRKALNYNNEANRDDGSCRYEIKGCMDSSAINYNSKANTSDGTCLYQKEEVKEEAIPFETEYHENGKGKEEKILQEGTEGIKKITKKIIVDEKGNVKSEEIASEEVIKEAKNKIVQKGSLIEKQEDDEVSNAQGIFYIFLIIITVLIGKKNNSHTIASKINLCSSWPKYIIYIFYIALIIPIIIDLIIIVTDYFKSKK